VPAANPGGLSPNHPASIIRHSHGYIFTAKSSFFVAVFVGYKNVLINHVIPLKKCHQTKPQLWDKWQPLNHQQQSKASNPVR